MMITRLAPLATALLVLGIRADARPRAQEWTPLFNGKDLEGWKIKITGHELGDNYGNTFRVEDGVLKVGYDKYEKFEGKFGHIFYHKPFSHYRLRLEYRFVGNQVEGGVAGRASQLTEVAGLLVQFLFKADGRTHAVRVPVSFDLPGRFLG